MNLMLLHCIFYRKGVVMSETQNLLVWLILNLDFLFKTARRIFAFIIKQKFIGNDLIINPVAINICLKRICAPLKRHWYLAIWASVFQNFALWFNFIFNFVYCFGKKKPAHNITPTCFANANKKTWWHINTHTCPPETLWVGLLESFRVRAGHFYFKIYSTRMSSINNEREMSHV